MGSSTENSAYQVTANPWDVSRVPEALQEVQRQLKRQENAQLLSAPDTGGSIRQPASLRCGGNETNLWAVSRFGLVALLHLWIRSDRLDAQ